MTLSDLPSWIAWKMQVTKTTAMSTIARASVWMSFPFEMPYTTKQRTEPTQSIPWKPPMRLRRNLTNQCVTLGGVMRFKPYSSSNLAASSLVRPLSLVFRSS